MSLMNLRELGALLTFTPCRDSIPPSPYYNVQLFRGLFFSGCDDHEFPPSVLELTVECSAGRAPPPPQPPPSIVKKVIFSEAISIIVARSKRKVVEERRDCSAAVWLEWIERKTFKSQLKNSASLSPLTVNHVFRIKGNEENCHSLENHETDLFGTIFLLPTLSLS